MLDWSVTGWSIPWLFGDRLIGWLLDWLLEWLKIVSKSWENRSKINQKSIKNGPQIDQNRSKELSWRGLGPSWSQDGPKSPNNVENWFLGPPLGGHFGSQNRSKSAPRAIRKVIVLMIDLKIDFGIDLVPIWSHLGLQSPPKIDPSWLQNRCKLECRFESCFWKDVGSFFVYFLPQHDMAEVAKTLKNKLFFSIFEFLVVGLFGVICWLI